MQILNKKAKFEYHILESWEAGIALTGTEVKSLRAGNANIAEAWCLINQNEVFLHNAHISIFSQGSYQNHEPLRDRRLLLNKKEIKKIQEYLKENGTTIIPMKIYQSERGFMKVLIAVVKGKKLYDKREDIKKRDIERDLRRE